MTEILNKKARIKENTRVLNKAMEYNRFLTKEFISVNECTSIEEVAEKLSYHEVSQFICNLENESEVINERTKEFQEDLAQTLYNVLVESHELVQDIVKICEKHYNFVGEFNDADEVSTFLAEHEEVIGDKVQHDCITECYNDFADNWEFNHVKGQLNAIAKCTALCFDTDFINWFLTIDGFCGNIHSLMESVEQAITWGEDVDSRIPLEWCEEVQHGYNMAVKRADSRLI